MRKTVTSLASVRGKWLLAFLGMAAACSSSRSSGERDGSVDSPDQGASAIDGNTQEDASPSADGGPDDAQSLTDGPAACGSPFGAEPTFAVAANFFTVELGSKWLDVDGIVRDRAPVGFHNEAARSGMCRLLTYTPSFCDPSCAGDQICKNGVCLAQSVTLSNGAVTLRGFGDAAIGIQPNSKGRTVLHTTDYGLGDANRIRLSSTSGAVIPFDLEVCEISPPITPKEDWPSLLRKRPAGQDVTLTWSNPVDTARIYMHMTTGIGTHGGISPAEIECEGPDTGSLTLPGAYLDALYAKGWSCGECGENRLLRYHAAQSGTGDQLVQLRVQSYYQFFFVPPHL